METTKIKWRRELITTTMFHVITTAVSCFFVIRLFAFFGFSYCFMGWLVPLVSLSWANKIAWEDLHENYKRYRDWLERIKI